MKGDIFHVCNRGVNKQAIFHDRKDYLRFVESLYKLNNKNGALRSEKRYFFDNPPPQDKLVEICKWSILPNHYHLLLYEMIDGGVVEFVKRLGNSYTKYYNIKRKRRGYLFESKASIITIIEDKHFLYIPYYVELNPLDQIDRAWREEGIKDIKKATKFLIDYKWSSFPDYLGHVNFPRVINKGLFFDEFDTLQSEYEKEMWDIASEPKKTGGSDWIL